MYIDEADAYLEEVVDLIIEKQSAGCTFQIGPDAVSARGERQT